MLERVEYMTRVRMRGREEGKSLRPFLSFVSPEVLLFSSLFPPLPDLFM